MPGQAHPSKPAKKSSAAPNGSACGYLHRAMSRPTASQPRYGPYAQLT
jgi:hypothetical protein